MVVFITNEETYLMAIEFIEQNEVLTYDTETTGLNVRKDTVIGFGFSNSIDGFYIPLHSWNADLGVLTPAANIDMAFTLLTALSKKKLICFNASFDIRITYSNFGILLLDALYCDAMLLKHTCDEEFPFGLKEIATKLWGKDAKAEKLAMQASIKANGGKATEYYKADTTLLGNYCVQDCMLTARVYAHYSPLLEREGLVDFFYTQEVMPLYAQVTIPMEMRGVHLDMPLLVRTLGEIGTDIAQLEAKIQSDIAPNLELFMGWFLNKDYPLATATGKQPVWSKKGLTQSEKFAQDFPGQYMFNLQSKHHLKKLFFDTLALEPLSRTPTGLPQVDEEFLESIVDSVPWVRDLVTFNKLNKLKSTYLERLHEDQEEGIYYPSFAQHRTVSGRYAGDFQQMPRPIPDSDSLVAKYTNVIRRLVVPAPGYTLCSADYEQLEPSIFAHTSGDPALQNIFKSGRDFYSEVAIKTEGLAGSSDKQAADYIGKTQKAARQKAKAYALGIAYGMTGYKLKFEIGCTDEVADKLVRDYLAAFPQLASWMQSSKIQATTTGAVRSQAGRVRHLRRAKTLFAKYGASITDSLQLWKTYNADSAKYAEVKKDYREFKNLLNNAINFQVQSLAASIVNRAAICINRRLKTEQLKSALIAQIHDELLFDVHESEIEAVGALIQHEMQTVVRLEVPLRTVPQFGTTFAECK